MSTTPSAVPDVTVIIPAHNALPYVRRTLQSLVDQTIGHDRMEVVVVDDGSTDGTGAELDEWAQRHPTLFRVAHQPASGGPATPRNTGLDLARGRYVYFLDADDYLGVEALERLVATADEHGSDIVLGKMESDGERGVPRSMYRRTDPDVDLFDSRLWWTLAVLKLYRRSFVEEHALRFPTNYPNASDQPFAGVAYLRARKISVNADYDYYFVVRRDDGGHVTRSGSRVNRLDVVEWMCAMLVREVPDQAKREVLLHRHFQIELRRALGYLQRPVDDAEQAEVLRRVAALVREHFTPTLAARLNPRLRIALHLAGQERLDECLVAYAEEREPTPFDVVEEGGRWFAALPFFRDPAAEVPDHLYDVSAGGALEGALHAWEWQGTSLVVTGASSLDLVPLAEGETVDVVLRPRRATDATHDVVVPAQRTGSGLLAELDVARADGGGPLAAGSWVAHLRIARGDSLRILRITTGKGAAEGSAVEVADGVVTCRKGAKSGLTLVVRRDARPPEPPGLLERARRRLRPTKH